MSLADDLEKISELHRAGSISDAEFAAAKAQLLAGAGTTATPGKDAALVHELREAKREARIARLDSGWMVERERHMVSERYGARRVSSKTGSIVGGVFAIVVAIIAAAVLFSSVGGAVACLVPPLILIVGLGTAIYNYSKATDYEEAEARYQQNREQAMRAEDDEG